MDYKPKLVESLLNPNSLSLDVNNKRKTLFSGKTFICSTVNQLNRLSKLVKLAGGEIMNYSDGSLSDDDILSCTKYILLQQDPHNEENNYMYQQILEKLKIANKRSIPENDVGFAIIFSNTTKHCNANFNVSLVNLESQSNLIKSQESVVLAPETEVLTVNDSEIFSVNTVPDSLPTTIPDSLPNTIPDSHPNTIPDSHPNTECAFKRPLEVVSDSEEIILPTKRLLLANSEEKNNSIKTIRIEKDLKPFQNIIEPTPSSSNHDVQSPIPKTQTVDNTFTNDNLCLTTASSTQYISSTSKLSAWLQGTVADNNVNNTNNLQSKTVENLAVPTKRKISNDHQVFNNENEDPFNYMDIDEVEEHPKKKPKKRDMDSLFFPMLDISNNKSEPSKTMEPNPNIAVDPNFIMNLLSEAKGTGQFIDASILSNKSSANTHEDTEYDYLLNSVIVETVSMVVSRPTQTANIIQGNNSNLRNFKKFKKKGPSMRIPYIYPMEFTQID
ncbi:nibrin [Acyrthosiphon pisum]|uniref:Nibrin second BRCT domain-containing protein n=1 Tax=Acyrthosiphon pisum TaxID=7029 RepID=A0A8R2BBB7_ACYPI|nr:nibrin [Acyrthosiphon pisum]|eukprot:XP_008190066.1 PREDICTED: nibrin [Acyrthosiphon pisum]